MTCSVPRLAHHHYGAPRSALEPCSPAERSERCEVIGDLPRHAEDQGGDDGPTGEPARPVTDRALTGQPGVQRERGKASTPMGRVTAVSTCRESQMPGSGRIGAVNAVVAPRPASPRRPRTGRPLQRSVWRSSLMRLFPGKNAIGNRAVAKLGTIRTPSRGKRVIIRPLIISAMANSELCPADHLERIRGPLGDAQDGQRSAAACQ